MNIGIQAITVFIQGILSFFSPCVLPLVPLYIGYLAGGTKTVDEQGRVTYSRKKVLVNTVFFVVGVSFAFFALGLGFSAAKGFFKDNEMLFARIGGIIVILFGLFQLGIFGSSMLEREHRLPFRLNQLAMNPLLALAMGFTFSFAWTPCVGPALASVLLMATSAAYKTTGFFLIGVYTLGFIIPFLAVGIFTGSVLDFFKRHQNVVKYTTKIAGVLMIAMGIMMFTGWMNGVTGYLSKFSGPQLSVQDSQIDADYNDSAPGTDPQEQDQLVETAETQTEEEQTKDTQTAESQEKKSNLPPPEDRVAAPEFALTDQFGEEHSLSDYKGKVVFLNFWATWCPPCKKEMPDIEEIYKEYGENSNDLVILSVANPKTVDNPNNSDVSIEEVTKFMEDNGYTYPVLMDTTGDSLVEYYITAFPTTFIIDREGRVAGYASGMLTKDIMKNIITEALED